MEGYSPEYKKKYYDEIVPALQKEFNYKSVMQVPKLEKIVINDLREHTFYARLIINKKGEKIEIDSRPSDAIALGAATNMPIYVAEHVLQAVT